MADSQAGRRFVVLRAGNVPSVPAFPNTVLPQAGAEPEAERQNSFKGTPCAAPPGLGRLFEPLPRAYPTRRAERVGPARTWANLATRLTALFLPGSDVWLAQKAFDPCCRREKGTA